MTNEELNEMIDWCRTKLENVKKNRLSFSLNTRERYGYEQAMKAVMSYLHNKKGDVK